MKRITFRGLLAALLLFCSVPLWAYDFTAENDDGITLYYTITSEEGAEVKTVEVANNGKSSYGSTDYSGAIVIPSTVENDGNTYSVTSIGARAFASHWELTSVIIPSGVTSIESNAFYDCEGLTSVEIPGSVISIGEYAFFSCSALTSVSMSYGVESIGAYAFYECGSLPSIELPNSVKSIGTWAFVLCPALTSIDIPNSVRTIGQEAFAACVNLEEVTIGEGVDSIGQFMLRGSQKISVLNYNATSVSSEYSGTAPIFYDCAIDTFNIGTNVTNMRTYTIVNSTVSKLYSFSSEPPILESGAFAGSIGVAFVPEDAGATYASTAVWSDLSNIIEMTVTIPMTTDEGYVTRYSPYSYVLEKGLKGGVITDADAEGALTIDWLYDGDSDDATKYTVPADLAILIKGPENATSESAENHSFVNWTINTDNDTYPKPDKNMLYGSQTAVTTYVPDENSDDYRFYKLAYFYPEIIDEETGEGTGEYDYDNGTLGFYWGDTEGDNPTNCGGPFTNGAKLAWLAIPKDETETSDAKISFYPLEGDSDIEPDNNATDNETTGITAASADVQVATKTIYNLQGVRVGDMSKKGIYIVDGRKVVKQ